MSRKLKHLLRYYLNRQIVDVGGYKVPYTPADEHEFEIRFKGEKMGTLRVIGGYVFVSHKGLDLVKVSEHYAGEM